MIREPTRAELRVAVVPFETPSWPLALYQIATSIGLYLAIVGLMYWSVGVSYILTLALAVPASA